MKARTRVMLLAVLAMLVLGSLGCGLLESDDASNKWPEMTPQRERQIEQMQRWQAEDRAATHERMWGWLK
jgi:outer membrane biogenesis lipoprotein LolB